MSLERSVRQRLLEAASEAPEPGVVVRRVKERIGAPGGAYADVAVAVNSRRRWSSVILPLAAVAAVVTVVLGASLGLPGQQADAPAPVQPVDRPVQPVPTPSEAGTHYVGLHNIVAAVPNSWSLDDVQCGVVQSDTVIFQVDAQTLCQFVDEPLRVSAIRFAETSSDTGGHWLAETHPAGELDGYGYRIRDVDTAPEGASMILAVPDLDVVIWVGGRDSAEVSAYAKSIRVLPDAYVTVPPIGHRLLPEAMPLLEAAGLEADVQRVSSPPGVPDEIVEMSAEPGSVQPRGATIQLTVAD